MTKKSIISEVIITRGLLLKPNDDEKRDNPRLVIKEYEGTRTLLSSSAQIIVTSVDAVNLSMLLKEVVTEECGITLRWVLCDKQEEIFDNTYIRNAWLEFANSGVSNKCCEVTDNAKIDDSGNILIGGHTISDIVWNNLLNGYKEHYIYMEITTYTAAHSV
jgi:hypothetical protein